MKIELPYPDKSLWPNGRPHHMAKYRATKAARAAAYYATKGRMALDVDYASKPLQIALTVHPKPKGPLPDRDNCAAAIKAYQDGIADALKVNDRNFKEPTVTFGERTKYGAFVLTI